jgi:hypothetical protein
MASGAARRTTDRESDMTERAEDFDRDDERDQYGAKNNDNQGSSAEQAAEHEREMEESGEENAA